MVNGSVWGVLIKLARCALCVGRRGRASSFKAGQSELASYRGGAARENHDFRGIDGTRVAVEDGEEEKQNRNRTEKKTRKRKEKVVVAG